MRNITLSIFWLSILTAVCCSGGVRRFTYVYEATTSAPGGFDLETWITWRTHTRNDPNLDQIDFRHELEVGITQSLQASVYLADWNYQDGIGSDGFSYSDSAVELIYNLTNPVIDPVGLSIYQEYRIGDRRDTPWSKPSTGGPNPSRYFFWPPAAIVASVRPWNAPSKVIMR